LRARGVSQLPLVQSGSTWEVCDRACDHDERLLSYPHLLPLRIDLCTRGLGVSPGAGAEVGRAKNRATLGPAVSSVARSRRLASSQWDDADFPWCGCAARSPASASFQMRLSIVRRHLGRPCARPSTPTEPGFRVFVRLGGSGRWIRALSCGHVCVIRRQLWREPNPGAVARREQARHLGVLGASAASDLRSRPPGGGARPRCQIGGCSELSARCHETSLRLYAEGTDLVHHRKGGRRSDQVVFERPPPPHAVLANRVPIHPKLSIRCRARGPTGSIRL
jgi:hypothetical protein